MTDLVATIKAEMKAAMKARDKPRLGTIRLIQAEFKRIEVDERIDIDDARALTILDKMVKQRRDSATQYRDANREELAAQEDLEIAVIQEFLPEQLGEADIAQARILLVPQSTAIQSALICVAFISVCLPEPTSCRGTTMAGSRHDASSMRLIPQGCRISMQ